MPAGNVAATPGVDRALVTGGEAKEEEVQGCLSVCRVSECV